MTRINIILSVCLNSRQNLKLVPDRKGSQKVPNLFSKKRRPPREVELSHTEYHGIDNTTSLKRDLYFFMDFSFTKLKNVYHLVFSDGMAKYV